MTHRILVVIAAFVILSCAVAYAQPATADITFPFKAGTKSLAAGTYTFEMPDANSISVFGPGGKAILVVMTRLGRRMLPTDLELVFDDVNGQYSLSEVWFADQDGYLVGTTKGAHKHMIVTGNPKK